MGGGEINVPAANTAIAYNRGRLDGLTIGRERCIKQKNNFTVDSALTSCTIAKNLNRRLVFYDGEGERDSRIGDSRSTPSCPTQRRINEDLVLESIWPDA
jgi:hypothetical protein